MRHSVISREHEVLRSLISKTPKKGSQSMIALSLLSELSRLVKLTDEVLHRAECAVRGKGSCVGKESDRQCHTGCYGYRVVEKLGELSLFRSTDTPLAITLKEGSIRVSVKHYSLELAGSKAKIVLRDAAKEVEVDLANREDIVANTHIFRAALPEIIKELEIANTNIATCLRLSAIACT